MHGNTNFALSCKPKKVNTDVRIGCTKHAQLFRSDLAKLLVNSLPAEGAKNGNIFQAVLEIGPRKKFEK